MIIAVILGVGIPILIITLSLKKDVGILPMGGTCSAVVSAACHRHEDDKEAHLFPVMWGEEPAMARQMSPESTLTTTPTSASPALKVPRWKAVKSVQESISILTARALGSRKSHSDGHSEPTAVATTNATDDHQQPSPGVEQFPTRTRTDLQSGVTQESVRHCCFTTSISLREPQEGGRYA